MARRLVIVRRLQIASAGATLVAAIAIVSAAPGFARAAEDGEAVTRSRAAIEAIASGRSECTLGRDGAVRYIGPTDDSLVACLSEYSRDGKSLLISSGGGDASKAIEAGEILTGLHWDVRVLGMCASSCGNYILPSAASVAVEPYSAILLHGGPVDSEAFIRLVQDQAEAKQRAAYPDVTAEVVQQGRTMMRSITMRVVAEHQAFVSEHSVGGDWYDLTEFAGPAGGFTPSDFAVVDPTYLSREVSRVRTGDFWFPCTADERAQMTALITDAQLYYRPERDNQPRICALGLERGRTNGSTALVASSD